MPLSFFSPFSPIESQLLNITSQPTSPVTGLEGQPLRLEWKFSVQGTFLRVQLSFSGAAIAFLEKTLTTTFLIGRFTGRLTASATETNATITFLSLNRTDSNDYVFAVLDTNGASVTAPLQVVVQCKCLILQLSLKKPLQAILDSVVIMHLRFLKDKGWCFVFFSYSIWKRKHGNSSAMTHSCLIHVSLFRNIQSLFVLMTKGIQFSLYFNFLFNPIS